MSRRVTPPRALDPVTVRDIIIAFDEAAEALRHGGTKYRDLSPSMRTSLARTLIELAEHGVRDPLQLKEAALARFRRH